MLAESLVVDARYWGLRTEIGGTGLALVEPRRALLPPDAQRGLAALARRRVTRWAIVGPLRVIGRLGHWSRAERDDLLEGHDRVPEARWNGN